MKVDKINKVLQVVVEYIKIIFIAFILSGIVMCFIRITKVEGKSMEHTLQDKDILLLNRRSYKKKNLEYRDIVVIDTFNGENNFIIKRVIAIEGDTFEIKNNKILLNDKELDEEYTKLGENTKYEDFSKITIPKDKIFAMGDNRENSADSRVYGVFDCKEQIIGEIMIGLVPFKSPKDLLIENR